MRTPTYLREGDKIAIVAPAKKIAAERIENAVHIFESWGLRVVTGKNVLGSNNYFAGTDEERAADFQEMLNDESVKAIICARGGYGTVRIIDRLDFSVFSKNPKWIAGYSDITVLHSHIANHLDVETIHAPMPLDYPKEKGGGSVEYLRKALFGEQLNFEFTTDEISREGSAAAEIVGGNVSVLNSLTGSVSDLDTTNRILFLEEVGENLYHFDRMMRSLKRAGKFENIRGLIIGRLSGMRDNNDATAFNKTSREIINEVVRDYDFPVCYGFPAGHDKENLAFIHGRRVSLSVDTQKSIIYFLKNGSTPKKRWFIKNLAIITLTVVTFFLIIYLIYYLAIKFLT